jgi:hypothetical protein
LLHVLRVAADDEQGLRLWLPAGSPFWSLGGQDGVDVPAQRTSRLVRHMWTGSDVMIWMPEHQPYSVSWVWSDGAFAGWHAHLEEPYVRWADRGCAGVDTADRLLEVVVRPDRSWRHAGETDFHARTGDPLYWTPGQAAQFRATADRLAQLADARQFPFDGTWCGFRPDASWTVPALPPGYDRPRALAPVPERRPGQFAG